jgi:hypothetical protein
MLCDEVGMCQNINHSSFNCEQIWGGHMPALKEKENLHFGILSLILKLEMVICLICNCELDETILDLIQQSTSSVGLSQIRGSASAEQRRG